MYRIKSLYDNKLKVTVDELSQSMGKLIPTAKSTGVNLEQVATGYAIMTSKGIKAAEATTYMNSMMNELGKNGTKASDALKDATGKTFQQLTQEGKSLGEVLSILTEHANKSGLSLSDMFGGIDSAKAGLILANNEGKDFNKTLAEMQNSSGATNKAFETMENTTGYKMQKSLNKMKNSLIDLGDKLAPTVEKLADGISNVADKIGEMDSETLASVIKFSAMAFAMGGVTKVTGNMISGFGSITGVLGKVATKMGAVTTTTSALSTAAGVGGATGAVSGLGGAMSTLASCVNPVTLGIGAATLATVAMVDHLNDEVIPTVDLFATEFDKMADGTVVGTVKISEATKTAVGAYEKMDDGVTKSLIDMQFNNTKVTTDIANDITGRFNQMGKTITDELNKDLDNNLKVMQDFFNESSTLTTEEQASMQGQLVGFYETQKQNTQNGLARISEIMNSASSQNREMTKAEHDEINAIRLSMEKNAIQSLSETEKESIAILSRIKDSDVKITADMASEHVKKVNEIRDKSVEQANIEYEERVRLAEAIRSEGGAKAEETANKIIEEAKRQKDGAIKEAKEQKEKAIDELKKNYADLDSTIDTKTGNIMSYWDRLTKKWDSWKPEPKEFNYDYVNKYDGKMPGFATGTQYAPEGFARVNENGYELHVGSDGITRALEGSIAYLNKGDKVINHAKSVSMLQRDIQSETSRQVSNALGNMGGAMQSYVGESISSNNNVIMKGLENIVSAINKKETITPEGIRAAFEDAIVVEAKVQASLDARDTANKMIPFLSKAQNKYDKSHLR